MDDITSENWLKLRHAASNEFMVLHFVLVVVHRSRSNKIGDAFLLIQINLFLCLVSSVRNGMRCAGAPMA